MDTSIIAKDSTNEVDKFALIQSKIYEIRGKNVMLDFDLADRYGIETSQLKRAVRRNIERFEGEDFMFELTREELSRCQIGTLNKGRGSNIKYLPFAFTELGVAMLSSVLNSEKAIKVNRDIMRAFVILRQYVLNYAELNQKIEYVSTRIDNNDIIFKKIFNVLDTLIKDKKKREKPRTPVGFKQNN
jgi:predicted AAA+ superfamily ATPase